MPRDIIEQPKIGSVAANDFPNKEYKGLNAGPIKWEVEDDGTVTFRTASRVLLSLKSGLGPDGEAWSIVDPSGFSVVEYNETNNEVILQINNGSDLIVSSNGVKIKTLAREVVAAVTPGATYTMNLSQGNVFNLTGLDQGITLSFSNVPPGYSEVTVRLVDDGTSRTFAVTGAVFDSGEVSTTTANENTVIKLYTFDGGTTWIGNVPVAGAV